MSGMERELTNESRKGRDAALRSAGELKAARVPKVRCTSIGAASDFLKAMANPVRLSILCVLMEGARTVGELEAILDVHQPTLSQQIGSLREGGLIRGRRSVREVSYRLADPRAGQIIGHLRLLFTDPEASSVWRGTSLDPQAARDM